MSLASRLPYDHAYSGGYPGIGSQALPTDADALDYLSRMATADGAGVETGVAVAVDAFFRDTKAAGVFDALKACCILAGARTLAGALVPVVGDAPTNVADGFVEGDFSRTSGLTGDGTSYIDSGRDGDDDPQNDTSLAVFVSSLPTTQPTFYIGDGNAVAGANSVGATYATSNPFFYARNDVADISASDGTTGLVGMSRAVSTEYVARSGSQDITYTLTSQTPRTASVTVFTEGGGFGYKSTATLAFYSIGTSLSLEDLDTTVTNLINRLKFALLVGENPSGLDPDTIDYIVRGYEAGGSLE